jgi:hypothetical protein
MKCDLKILATKVGIQNCHFRIMLPYLDLRVHVRASSS